MLQSVRRQLDPPARSRRAGGDAQAVADEDRGEVDLGQAALVGMLILLADVVGEDGDVPPAVRLAGDVELAAGPKRNVSRRPRGRRQEGDRDARVAELVCVLVEEDLEEGVDLRRVEGEKSARPP